MAELNGLIRSLALTLGRAACSCACLLPLSCAFGNADVVQSLFEDNGDPLFVAVGSVPDVTPPLQDYAIFTSPTGSIWSPDLVPVSEVGNLNCVVYGNGLFLSAGSPSNYYISVDGYRWEKGPDTGGTDTMNDGAYGNGRYIVVGSDGSGHVVTYASTDGAVWVKGNLSLPTPKILGVLYGITFGNGIFVAVGYDIGNDRSLIVTSADGIVWSGNLCRNTPAVTLNDVAYGNGLYVAAGANGQAIVSADGLIWSKNTIIISKDSTIINGLAWGNGMFMAVGDLSISGYSVVHLSEDGIVWSSNVNKGAAGSSILQDVAYCHGYFVVVGLDGRVLYSQKGLSWNGDTLESGIVLNAVTCRP